MPDTQTDADLSADWERRDSADPRPQLAGVSVREDDIESVRAIRAIARMFRGLSLLLLVLMVLQLFFAVTGTVPISVGVVAAEAVRLITFAGLLWVVGDLAVLFVKSHHDLRAQKIVIARLSHMVRQMGEASGKLPPETSGTRADREP